jgi:hypothetical protein
MPIAFSSEVDTPSREENASKQESGASVLIQSEPIALDDTSGAHPKTKKIAGRAPQLYALPVKEPPQAGVIQGDQSMGVEFAARGIRRFISREMPRSGHRRRLRPLNPP